MTTKSDTPNCDLVAQNSQARYYITDFMEWLQETQQASLMKWLPAWNNGHKPYLPCLRDDPDAVPHLFGGTWEKPNPMYEGRPEGYYNLGKTVEQLIMEYIGVDPVALENERRALLENFRKETGQNGEERTDEGGASLQSSH